MSKTVVEENYSKLKNILNMNDKKSKRKKKKDREAAGEKDKEAAEKEAEKIDDAEKEAHNAIPNANEQDDSDEESSDEEMLANIGEQNGGDSSRVQLYLKMTLSYSLALILVCGIFLGLVFVIQNSGTKLGLHAKESDFSARSLYLLNRLGYGIHMLTIDDSSTFHSINALHHEVEKDLEFAKKIYETVISGSDEYGVERGRIPDDIRDTLTERQYFDNT